MLQRLREDPVTGTATEAMLLRFADALLEEADSVGPQIGIICVEVDGLAELGRRLGQSARDAALLGVADRLRDHVRTQDLIARIDDGFVICLAETFSAPAAQAAERLRQAVAATPVPHRAGHHRLTCSLGLALSSSAADSAALLLARAQRARDTAVAEGGDRLVMLG